MKLLIVHNFYSVKGGGEDIVYEREKDALTNLLGKENVFAYTVTSASVRSIELIRGIFFSRKHYHEIYRMVKENDIDVVHVHNFFPVLSASVFKAAKDAGAKLVHTVHNYRWWCISGEFYRVEAGACTNCIQRNDLLSAIRYRCYRKSYIQSLVAKLAFAYYKWSASLQRIDLFFVLTGFQQMQLISLGIAPGKLRIKPNMVSLANVSRVVKKGYVFAGRLETSKGIEVLLEAWVGLPGHFVLTVVGSGSLKEQLRLRYRAQANIIFKGICTPAETRDILSGARYSIQPSLLYETFGLTIIESMNAGVPVIGFNIGTRPELIDHGKTGFITTPDQLADTILMSYDYPGYEIMSANAIKFATFFDTERILEQQVAIYQQLVHPV